MKSKLATSAILAGSLIANPASAEMLWSNFSLSYLNGNQYEFTPTGAMQVITIEHASGHSWGDNFLFIDRTMPEDGDSSFYGELSPRFSIGKITDNDLSFGPIKDVLVATTWEMGDGFDNFLYGVGLAIDIPGFNYFNANLYAANNDTEADDEQLTLTWAYPFNVGSQEFLIDGFLDWSSASEDNKSEMNFTPQIKWNIGKTLGTSSPLYVGLEYAYWNNKYGSDTNERAGSLLIKMHF